MHCHRAYAYAGSLHWENSQSAGNCLKRMLNPTFENRKIFPYFQISQVPLTPDSQHLFSHG